MRSLRARWLLYPLGLLFSLYLLRGILLLGYQPERSNSYLWGAFHVHSVMSDGLSDLETIAREARESKVAFVLLSDHGMPHPEASLLKKTIDGVRFIGGSEVGLPEGHLILIAPSQLPHYKLPPHPPEAFADVEEWGAFSVLTYPEDPLQGWSYWEPDLLPNGMELINITSDFRAGTIWDRLRWGAFYPFSRWYYLSSLSPPREALARWDELLSRGRVFGFYAANAHGGFRIGRDFTIRIPSYATAFRYAGLGMGKAQAEDPEEAIRSGNFFSILRAAGEPQRFEFEALAGEQRFPPGSRVEPGVTIEATVEVAALAPRLVLKRDGELLVETAKEHLRVTADRPGVYRLEVYLDDHPLLSPEVPWILSNPFFVGIPVRSPPDPVIDCRSEELFDLTALRLEMDPASEGTLEVASPGTAELHYHLSKATPEQVNRWVALALRDELDLSEAELMLIEGRASEPMRYWLELRAGERSFYASFKLTTEMERQLIPWDRFFAMFGQREPVRRSEIDSLFITVNTANSQTDFSSALSISKLGWCR